MISIQYNLKSITVTYNCAQCLPVSKCRSVPNLELVSKFGSILRYRYRTGTIRGMSLRLQLSFSVINIHQDSH